MLMFDNMESILQATCETLLLHKNFAIFSVSRLSELTQFYVTPGKQTNLYQLSKTADVILAEQTY